MNKHVNQESDRRSENPSHGIRLSFFRVQFDRTKNYEVFRILTK